MAAAVSQQEPRCKAAHATPVSRDIGGIVMSTVSKDIRRLERFLLVERMKSSADPGVLDMLETALSSFRLPNGASASSS